MTGRRLRNVAIVVAIAAAVGFIACNLAMTSLGAPITEKSEYSVLHLEFAWSPQTMDLILQDWGPELIAREILVTWVDFGYLAAYGALIWALGTIVTLRWGRALWFPLRMMPWAGPAAALLDVVENVHLLMVLYSPGSYPDHAPLVATLCAAPKFLLVGAALMFVVLVPASMGIRRLLSRDEN